MEVWDNSKRESVHTVGILEGAEKGKGAEEVFDTIMIEFSHN